DKDDENRHHRNIHVDGLDSRDWDLKFTDAIPIAFDVQLGVGKGDIDLTGLRVKDFTLSSGASSVTLHCDKPNKEVIQELNIEAGVSKFNASGLNNLHFRRLKFEGGVGSYTLDFGGELNKEVDADLEVGLGTLTIIIPQKIGAKIYYQKSWITHLNLEDDFARSDTDEDTYYSSNYATAKGKLNIHIDASLGSVRIRRADESDQ
ncbi:MAG TPA: LiaF domain-containing protein, partial [Bacteroidota bacterium]|nr:LiaF domain-containing protein [Bacteroidota bacterium]